MMMRAHMITFIVGSLRKSIRLSRNGLKPALQNAEMEWNSAWKALSPHPSPVSSL